MNQLMAMRGVLGIFGLLALAFLVKVETADSNQRKGSKQDHPEQPNADAAEKRARRLAALQQPDWHLVSSAFERVLE